MTDPEARGELFRLLGELSVKPGDTIYLGIDMAGVPLPAFAANLNRESVKAREARWCEFVTDSILEYLGPSGTIVVPSFSYSCAESDVVFDLQFTPCEVGRFYEHVRRRPQALRSCHPIFSVVAIGRYAKEITADVGRAAFGARSAFGRLAAAGTRFVCLGTRLRFSATYLHHLEQTYGCNHRFNKVFLVSVRRNGEAVPGPWLAYVAFRCANFVSDFSAIEDGLKSAGALKETGWGGRPFQSALIDDIDRVGYSLLERDPTAFASRRFEVRLNDGVCTAPGTAAIAEFDLVPAALHS